MKGGCTAFSEAAECPPKPFYEAMIVILFHSRQ
jgi:hypothetical protein